MFVLPQHDAVLAITSGVRDMQAVMNLVWEKLLPAMTTGPLPENAAARSELQRKLASLTMRLPVGRPAVPMARTVSGRWYDLAQNERGLRAMSLDLTSRAPVLVVRTAAGEVRTPIGIGTWARSRAGFTNGMERMLSVPSQLAVAASGVWTADSVFTVKLVAPETPFYSTMHFRFDGDRLVLDAEQNVSFGPRALPRLEGTATAGRSATPPRTSSAARPR